MPIEEDSSFVWLETPRQLIQLPLLILTHGCNGCLMSEGLYIPVAMSQAEEVYTVCVQKPPWPFTLSLAFSKATWPLPYFLPL